MNALREQPVVELEADLALLRLAIDEAAEGRELQAEALKIMEAGDLLVALPALRAAGRQIAQLGIGIELGDGAGAVRIALRQAARLRAAAGHVILAAGAGIED